MLCRSGSLPPQHPEKRKAAREAPDKLPYRAGMLGELKVVILMEQVSCLQFSLIRMRSQITGRGPTWCCPAKDLSRYKFPRSQPEASVLKLRVFRPGGSTQGRMFRPFRPESQCLFQSGGSRQGMCRASSPNQNAQIQKASARDFRQPCVNRETQSLAYAAGWDRHKCATSKRVSEGSVPCREIPH